MVEETQNLDLEKIETQIYDIVSKVIGLPKVSINRTEFLTTELNARNFNQEVIEKAIKVNPAYAGIDIETIDKIAESAINCETILTTSTAFTLGLPGGFAMAATIPADVVQSYVFVFRIMQKLAYLYGFKEFDCNNPNDELKEKLIIFLGVMSGVDSANKGLKELAKMAMPQIAKQLAKQPLTKGAIYPIVKQVCKVLGVKMTKQVFAKNVTKALPLIGGIIGGGFTLATFLPMANKLKDTLRSYDLCKPECYNHDEEDEEVIDVVTE